MATLKENLEKSKNFYQELWAYHLKSVMALLQTENNDPIWEDVCSAGAQLIQKYGATTLMQDLLAQAIIEIEGTVKAEIERRHNGHQTRD